MLQNEADAYRKMLLRVEEVNGKFCLTNFWVGAALIGSSALLAYHLQQAAEGLCCSRAWTSHRTSCDRLYASGRL